MHKMQGHILHFSIFSYIALWWAGFSLLLEWTIRNTMYMLDEWVLHFPTGVLQSAFLTIILTCSPVVFSHYTNHLPCTASVSQLPNPYSELNHTSVKLKRTALSDLWITLYFSKNLLVSCKRPQTAMSVFLSSHSFRGLHSSKSKSRGAVN